MNKKKLLCLFVLLNLLISIFAVSSPNKFSIKLNTVIVPELYTISLKYNNSDYSNPIVNASFNESFTSDVFSIDLSNGNEKSQLQFTIKIIPGTFIKDIENLEDNFYDTQFKPTPSLDTEFPIASSFYDETSKELTITSKIIPIGRNTTSQTLAKFYLGWEDDENLPKVSNGTYISTTIIEYTSEEVLSLSNSQ